VRSGVAERPVAWWAVLLVLAGSAPASAVELSPSFLGMYRKTMEVEHALLGYSKRYGVNPRTARAVLIQESGGNGHLVSRAGARGYFQVMPSTFRGLGVRTNIEAGIKYLGQLERRFGREDYAVAAYNAGPEAVARKRPLALETLQYVIGVGQYRSVLRVHEAEVVRQASALDLVRVHAGDTWTSLAARAGIPEGVLRLYNPFLTTRPLQAGVSIVRPRSAPPALLESDGDAVYYTSRLGDSYLSLAHVFEVDPETMRDENDLWRLQQLEPGVRLRIRLPADSPFRGILGPSDAPTTMVRAALGPSEARAAEPPVTTAPRTKTRPVANATTARATRAATKHTPAVRTHRVRRGETLGAIAQRYGTSARRLMDANGLRTPRVRAGDRLRIPSA
jgi:LysM repeat protein